MTTRGAPPPRRGSRDWTYWATYAKAHPGEWHLAFEQIARSTPNAAARGKISALVDKRYRIDLMTRNTNGNLADVYIMARRWTTALREERAQREATLAERRKRRAEAKALAQEQEGEADAAT